MLASRVAIRVEAIRIGVNACCRESIGAVLAITCGVRRSNEAIVCMWVKKKVPMTYDLHQSGGVDMTFGPSGQTPATASLPANSQPNWKTLLSPMGMSLLDRLRMSLSQS